MSMQLINRLTCATAIDKICSDLIVDDKETFDLGIVFFAQQNQATIKELIHRLKVATFTPTILSCACGGIIGSHQEIEFQPGISLLLMKLPSVKVTPFTLNQTQIEQFKTMEEWYHFFDIFPNEQPVFFVFPAPFEFDIARFIEGINGAYPGCAVVGGMASASSIPNENLLFLNDTHYTQGLVGVVLRGDIKIQTLVSQGCRPIGETQIITKAKGNVIYELASQPFLNVLRSMIDQLPERDKRLAQEALFVGLAISEYRDAYKRGDFLVRGLLAVDPKSGAGLIGDRVNTGQTIQFHVRDAHTATEDLHALLESYRPQIIQRKPEGAFLFSCNGRGEGLFGEKNHDINILQKYLGQLPVGGFFCAGEIGPVAGVNFIHGFTDSIAFFYPKEK